jgi:hypothetical protein
MQPAWCPTTRSRLGAPGSASANPLLGPTARARPGCTADLTGPSIATTHRPDTPGCKADGSDERPRSPHHPTCRHEDAEICGYRSASVVQVPPPTTSVRPPPSEYLRRPWPTRGFAEWVLRQHALIAALTSGRTGAPQRPGGWVLKPQPQPRPRTPGSTHIARPAPGVKRPLVVGAHRRHFRSLGPWETCCSPLVLAGRVRPGTRPTSCAPPRRRRPPSRRAAAAARPASARR